ncbi:MAG: hypothetical protein Q8K32_04695 [Archangium sp.]|nr:hypothetical protein [Archangium sp.]
MRLHLTLLALLLAGCPQYTGPQPDATYFWQIKTSTLEFGACSDAPDFREGLTALPITDNTFVIYKVSSDGKQAVTQKCDRLDSSTCSPSDSRVVFDVTGRELNFNQTNKAPIGMTGCSLQQTETWTLTDATRAMTLDLVNVLTLVDSQPACDQVEADLKARSPNGLGVEGCVITSKLTGELK